jgi:hypothetical protein
MLVMVVIDLIHRSWYLAWNRVIGSPKKAGVGSMVTRGRGATEGRDSGGERMIALSMGRVRNALPFPLQLMRMLGCTSAIRSDSHSSAARDGPCSASWWRR